MDYSIEDYINKIKEEKNIILKSKYINFLHFDKQVRTKDLAEYLKLKPSYISNLYRLRKLPDYIIDGYYSKTIPKSVLFTLSRLNTENQMLRAYEEILTKGLTPNQVEELVREIKYGSVISSIYLDKEYKERIKDEIEKKIRGLTVDIIQSRIRGKILIKVKGGTNKTTYTMKNILDTLAKVKNFDKDS